LFEIAVLDDAGLRNTASQKCSDTEREFGFHDRSLSKIVVLLR
jgi:hypothetical protein